MTPCCPVLSGWFGCHSTDVRLPDRTLPLAPVAQSSPFAQSPEERGGCDIVQVCDA